MSEAKRYTYAYEGSNLQCPYGIPMVKASDYDTLTAKVAELEASIRTDNTATLQAAEARIAALEKELEDSPKWAMEDRVQIIQLKAHLIRYGWHEEGCHYLIDLRPCTCGFEDLRQSLADGGGG